MGKVLRIYLSAVMLVRNSWNIRMLCIDGYGQIGFTICHLCICVMNEYDRRFHGLSLRNGMILR